MDQLEAILQAATYIKKSMMSLSSFLVNFSDVWRFFCEIAKHVFKSDFGLQAVTFAETENSPSIGFFRKLWDFFAGKPQPTRRQQILIDNRDDLSSSSSMLGRRTPLEAPTLVSTNDNLHFHGQDLGPRLDVWSGCSKSQCSCCWRWEFKSQLNDKPSDESIEVNPLAAPSKVSLPIDSTRVTSVDTSSADLKVNPANGSTQQQGDAAGKTPKTGEMDDKL